MKEIIVLSIAFLGVGCNPFGESKSDSTEIVKSGWAKNRQRALPNALYCYKTLGDNVCYTHPIKGAEERLAGDYDNIESIPDSTTVWEDTKKAWKDGMTGKDSDFEAIVTAAY